MYKVLKSSNTGVDEFDIEDMEKGCWIDIVSPSTEEIDEIANANCHKRRHRDRLSGKQRGYLRL